MTSLPHLLQDLVRLPSINPMGQNFTDSPYLENRVTDYLEAFFTKLGVSWHRQVVSPGRDNIIARLETPEATSTILWEVHQDTVPVRGMTIDPFAGEIKEGRLYGRGACDVKGGMASMLFAFARLAREQPIRKTNIVLACTVDEEHTFLGVQKLAAEGIRADFAVVAEPTNLDIVDCHKGVVRWKVRTEGVACHSSTPELGTNAIYRMATLLPFIECYAQELSTRPSHAVLGPATLSVGRIDGGVSVNTVPDNCVIEIDRRLLPGESGEAAWEEFQQTLAARSPVPFLCEPVWLSCPALDAVNSSPLCERLGRAIDSVIGKHRIRAVPFGTDASSISEAGIPAVVFGPGLIDQAHTKDEWIELKQVEQAAEILYQLAINEQ
jgi:acetylornithine deacetylase/succinyl-diaminopimelate desuccinylase family protein